jgi:hypothetical protein
MKRPWILLSGAVLLSITLSHAESKKPSAIHSIPFSFEANHGQAPAGVGFVFHREGMAALFSVKGVEFVFTGRSRGRSTVQLMFAGRNGQPDGQDKLAGHANYFVGDDPGKWITGVPLYSRVRYRDIYPGINLVFYGNGTELEHDFIVNPGADPGHIALRLKGASSLHLRDGNLVVSSENSELLIRKPAAYQTTAGKRVVVESELALDKDGTVRFRIGRFDRSRPLIIDPVLVFSTYLAGTGSDIPTGLATDAAGNVLLTGFTSSTDFPLQNPEQKKMAGCVNGSGCQNAFVTKFDPTGTTLIYSTYLGGSTGNIASSIAVGGTGNAIITGITSSADFPRAGAPAGSTLNCSLTFVCAFIASLTPDGATLNYSGPIGGQPSQNALNGGESFNQGIALAADSAGNAYLTGTTQDTNFLVTPGTLGTSFVGYRHPEMFVLKADPTGAVVYSTPVPATPPTNPINPAAIHVDAAGNVTIAGTAGPGLPTTAGVVAGQLPTTTTAGFVLQLNATASAINYASYLPGTDYGNALAVDESGNLWVAGATMEPNLPVSANAYMKTITVGLYQTSLSGYVMELSAGAKTVLGATFLNGTAKADNESTNLGAIALDSHGNVFVGGMTGALDFPMVSPFATVWKSQLAASDMALAALSPDLSTLQFGSFLNPHDTSTENGSILAGLVVDATGHPLVTGLTMSTKFMTTPGSFEVRPPPATNSSSVPEHTFVAKFDMSASAPGTCPDIFSVNFGNVNVNSSTNQIVNVTDCGDVELIINSITSTDPSVTGSQSCVSTPPASVCPVTLTFTPSSTKVVNGSVSLASNAPTALTIPFTGQGVEPISFSPAQGGSTSATVASGATATYNLLLTAGSQSSGSFGLTCSGAPQHATCSLTPQTLNLAARQSGSFTVTVNTETTSPAAQRNGFGRPFAGAGLLSMAGLLLFGRMRRGLRIKVIAVCAMALPLAAGVVSCGGGGGSTGGGGGGTQTNKTPAGTYSLNITAQGGGATAMQNLTLIIQ